VHDTPLIFDLVLALVAAFAGGMIARRLGLPELVGYLVGGVAIGANTPGLVASQDRVELLANLGVGFLMFALGVEFSLSDLSRVRRIVVTTGAIQIPVMIAVGWGVGTLFGWSWQASLLLGGAFSISSSIVAIKTLMQRGEGSSPHTAAALGIGVVQDLALVPMVALLPVLQLRDAGQEGSLAADVVRALVVAAVAIGLVVVVGTRIVPRIFELVARTRSRELFILTVVLIAFGAAWASEQAGLSLALGAFLAGLVVSESEFDTQVLADTIPFRDFFSVLFFVSVGMLFDPRVIVDQPLLVATAIAALMIGKLLIVGAALLAVRVDHVTATMTAIILAQMGEFSFLLAGLGRDGGIIDNDQHALILVAAVGSILLMPGTLALAPRLIAIANRLPGVHAREEAQVGFSGEEAELEGHVLVCGYGRVGRELGAALRAHGRPFAVIDLNPGKIRALRKAGIPAFYGDAGNQDLLAKAGLERARVLAITYPDFVTARTAMHAAAAVNPHVRVIARATAEGEIGPLDALGADEIVQPEFEAGMEFVRQALAWCADAPDATDWIDARRGSYYDPDVPPGGSVAWTRRMPAPATARNPHGDAPDASSIADPPDRPSSIDAAG
jgi:monovalent cation:H+ antiporter-2, CPA2 family